MWWPKMDSDIETWVRTCEECQWSRPDPPSALLYPWEWPKVPWETVHLDYAVPINGEMLLVIVDAHSKWIEVCVEKSSTAEVTVRHLQRVLAIYGIPKIVVTDNGPCSVSEVFEDRVMVYNMQG